MCGQQARGITCRYQHSLGELWLWRCRNDRNSGHNSSATLVDGACGVLRPESRIGGDCGTCVVVCLVVGLGGL